MTATDIDALIDRLEQISEDTQKLFGVDITDIRVGDVRLAATSLRTAQHKLAQAEGEISHIKECNRIVKEEYQAAQADNARMREALTPFAEFCEGLNPDEPDYEKFIYKTWSPRDLALTFGHFRAARAALPSPPETSETK